MDLHSEPYETFDDTRPHLPLSIVCVDGTAASDRALLWAFKHLPIRHGLLLVQGVKLPKASIDVHRGKVKNRRSHLQLAAKYRDLCMANGRACGMVHFHIQRNSELGDSVCSYARLRQAEGVITGRRSSDLRRAVFGSVASHVMAHCPDVWVTVVPATSKF